MSRLPRTRRLATAAALLGLTVAPPAVSPAAAAATGVNLAESAAVWLDRGTVAWHVGAGSGDRIYDLVYAPAMRSPTARCPARTAACA
jgi:hypothetical protein